MAATLYVDERTMAEREAIFNYWDQFSDDPTVETMMLNPNASMVDELDKKDILEGLPRDMSEMSVLEIGAGIGRFTEPLAKRSKEVHATDFIESFVDKNRELHSELYPNVSFAVSDAVQMIQSPSSRDLVFTNWLLMYLTDAEVICFLSNCLQWIRPGGYLHMRESCTESSTRSKSTDPSVNPTRYRHVSQYIQLLENLIYKDPEDGQLYTFKVLWARSVRAYIMAKSNWRQCQLFIRKVPVDKCSSSSTSNAETPIPTMDWLKNLLSETAQKQGLVDKQLQGQQLSQGTLPENELKLHMEIGSVLPSFTRASVLCANAEAVNCFRLAEDVNTSVMGLVSDPYAFSALLGAAVDKGDKRVAFTYTKFDEDSWIIPRVFNVICGCEYLRTNHMPHYIFTCLKKSLLLGGKFIFTSKTSSEVFEQLMNEFNVLTVSGSNVETKEPFCVTPDYSSASSDEEEKKISNV